MAETMKALVNGPGKIGVEDVPCPKLLNQMMRS